MGQGLMCHFFQDENRVRMWHPFEVLLHHGMCDTQFVHHDWKLAWQHAGNQIGVPHALLLLVNAMRIWKPHDATWNVDFFINALGHQHATAQSVKCEQGHILSRSH